MSRNRILLPIAIFLLSLAPSPALSAEKPSCREVHGLDAMLGPGAVLLLGELHGTREAPAFTANVACAALAAGLPVKVGLEIHDSQAETFATFLDSAGGEADRGALLSTKFWTREYQDGRSSQAMAELLEALRALRAGGGALEVLLFDSATMPQKITRDQAMGERLRDAIKSDPRSLFIVLTGNLHSRIAKGSPWDPEFLPMGYFIRQGIGERSLVALNLSTSGGTAWTCQGSTAESCGAQRFGGRGEGEGWRVTVDGDEPGDDGHHGRYFVGAMNASPPAVGTTSD